MTQHRNMPQCPRYRDLLPLEEVIIYGIHNLSGRLRDPL
jgi:hypothetical protein